MKINDDLIGTVKNSTKWNNMENDIGTTNNSDTWIPVVKDNKLQHTTINSIVSRGIKTKTINDAPINNYGNVALGLMASSAMVLGVKFANTGFNSIPFINANSWYCYVVKNQPQNTLNIQTSGTVTATVYYVEF